MRWLRLTALLLGSVSLPAADHSSAAQQTNTAEHTDTAQHSSAAQQTNTAEHTDTAQHSSAAQQTNTAEHTDTAQHSSAAQQTSAAERNSAAQHSSAVQQSSAAQHTSAAEQINVAEQKKVAVIISADAEWREVKKFFPCAHYQRSPYGEFFALDRDTVIFQGGWGKISAAASAQYVIDHWNPASIVNLGTCGGIAGRIDRFATVLVTKTVVYDIVEQMGDAAEAIHFYSTHIDLRWLPDRLPMKVVRAPLYSADRDLVAKELPTLIRKYRAVAGDWESGAIAWVASRNGKRVLILRGVSDLVTPNGGEAYGKTEVFEQGAGRAMKPLLDSLPQWLALLPR